MSPEIWWYVSRASGIVAWMMLTGAVVLGTVLSARLLLPRRAAWLLDLHRWLGGLAVCFLAAYLVALLLDSYAEFGLLDVLLPFASEWRPVAGAWAWPHSGCSSPSRPPPWQRSGCLERGGELSILRATRSSG